MNGKRQALVTEFKSQPKCETDLDIHDDNTMKENACAPNKLNSMFSIETCKCADVRYNRSVELQIKQIHGTPYTKYNIKYMLAD